MDAESGEWTDRDDLTCLTEGGSEDWDEALGMNQELTTDTMCCTWID